MSGYVLTHRRVYKNPVFRNAIEASAFVWLFAHASWQPTRQRYKNRIVDLQRGELALSVRDLAEPWGWTKAKAESFLARLRGQDMIRTDSRTGINIITICNYDKYQLTPDSDRTQEKTLTGQRPDSDRTQNNKENEVKEEGSVAKATDADGVVGAGSDEHGRLLFRLARKAGRPSAPTELRKLGLEDLRIEMLLRTALGRAEPRSYLAGILNNRQRDGPKHWNDHGTESGMSPTLERLIFDERGHEDRDRDPGTALLAADPGAAQRR